MELIDESALGVRSSVMKFRKVGAPTEVLIIPMLHLAAPTFYRKVHALLQGCQVVLAEGVPGWRSRLLTISYRLAGRWRRGGLIDQGQGLPLCDLTAEVIRPDMSASELAQGWRGLPWTWRIALWLVAPFYGLWLLIAGPQRLLAGRVALDDDPSAEGDDQLDELLLDRRDALLVAELWRQIDKAGESPQTIGVCWGAAHVPAVARSLIKHGYQARETEWVRVL